MGAYRGFKPFDKNGNRTYLTAVERRAFLSAARRAHPKVMTFCTVLAYTGARLSEVRALTPENIDFALQCIVIKCLKKRGAIVYRAVPVPQTVLAALDRVHMMSKLDKQSQSKQWLWPWCRTTAWCRVSEVMREAELSGVGATARGLRHTFAVSAVQYGAALNMVQKWMGHADIETTALYANAVGDEELGIAARVWESY